MRKKHENNWFWYIVACVLLLVFTVFRPWKCEFFWSAIGSVGTIFSAFLAVSIYQDTVKREKGLATIKELSKIRDKYSTSLASQERLNYLKEMERFCTGVNLELYDIDIIDRMSGSMLISQYDDYMACFVKSRRSEARQVNATPSDLYCEYEEMIKTLKSKRNKCNVASTHKSENLSSQ